MESVRHVLITPRSLQPREGKHHPEVGRLLQAGLHPVYPEGQGPFSAEAMARLVPGACAAIIGLDAFDGRVVEAGTALRVVARYGAGYDRVDVAACTARGIPVTNTPDANTKAVAEYTLALMLAAARHVPEHHMRALAGRWEPVRGLELSGRRLGLIGLGRIGQEVARRAGAFGMSLGYYDVLRKPPAIEESLGVRYMSFEDLLAWAEIVSLHAPYQAGSPPLLGAREFAMMRPGTLLVNTARGELIDEEALVCALREGHLAGAALDVFSHEPLPASHPFLTAPNLLLSPHAGAHTAEAVRRMAEAAVDGVLDVLGGRRPRYLVNPEVYEGRAS